jgi:AcrR family transcriptional regulator
MDAGLLPELIPTRQARSLRTVLALLDAGKTLLHQRSLEELSVEALCAEAGATVGSFYGRFESKHAFFVTMQRIHVIRAREFLPELEAQLLKDVSSLERLCQGVVKITVNRFRDDLGVLRASLQHCREGMWEPLRRLGEEYRAVVTAQIAPHLEHLPPKTRELRVRFGFQALTGTLVHAVLNNPGPLGLDDDRLVGELSRLLHSYMEAPL